MKMYKWIITGLCSLTAGMASGQTEAGRLMWMTEFQPTDMLDLSRYNYAYGTARSAAMGGAFGSLGGDLSSIGINPAGLGMYRSSEFGISFGLGLNQLNHTYSAGQLSEMGNNRTRFGVNNLSVALNTYQGTGALTSFTLGFGYNKVADFNSRSTITLPRDNTSIAQMFMSQLNVREMPLENIRSASQPFVYQQPFLWGSILAYQTALIDPLTNDDDNTAYQLTGLEPGVSQVDPVLRSTREGSIGEYSIAGGFNFNNKLYLGLSMGIQDIYLLQKEELSEWYLTDEAQIPPGSVIGNYLNNMYWSQELRMSGTGVNLKLGVIARPTDALRIGVAVHTPTWVKIDRDYRGYMYTEFNDGVWNERSTNKLTYQYDFNTPARLMGGVSYTFGEWGVLSADYERAWYNGMRVSDKDNQREGNKTLVQNTFQATNNVRVGGEFKPIPQLSLRAGYAYYQSPIQNNDWLLDAVAMQRTSNISAGIGYRFGSASIDLAYTHIDSKFSSYDLFFYEDGATTIAQAGYVTPKLTDNLVTLSFAVRF